MTIVNVPAAFLAEFLFTFALAYVVLNTATAKGTIRQFILRPGHRNDGDDGRLCRWRHFRRRV